MRAEPTLYELTKAPLGATESQPLFIKTAPISNISAFWVFSLLSRQEPLYCNPSKTAALMSNTPFYMSENQIARKKHKVDLFPNALKNILIYMC